MRFTIGLPTDHVGHADEFVTGETGVVAVGMVNALTVKTGLTPEVFPTGVQVRKSPCFT